MADKSDKQKIPAYVGFNSFVSFINGLRETSIPHKIDKSVMPKASGSQYSATIAALRFLNLVGDADRPTQKMQHLVEAADSERRPLWNAVVMDAYSFLFNDDSFHLERATGNQVAEKFRAQEVSGSTVAKSISFFLSLADAAGVKVSQHVKPPSVPRPPKKTSNSRPAKRESASGDGDDGEQQDDGRDDDATEVQRFEIPIPGKKSVRVIAPSNLDADDWTMFQTMFTAYITRWKSFK